MHPLVAAYTHCPLCGSPDYAHAPSATGGTRHCRACGHRDFNTPVAAVAALILDPRNRLLLIRRAKDPGRGLLALPGGFVDPGESLEQAVHREIAEETGLALTDLRYLTSHPNPYAYAGLTRPVCDAFFQARAASFDVVLQAAEVTDWQLRPLAELDPAELAFDSMRHAVSTLRASLGQTAWQDPIAPPPGPQTRPPRDDAGMRRDQLRKKPPPLSRSERAVR